VEDISRHRDDSARDGLAKTTGLSDFFIACLSFAHREILSNSEAINGKGRNLGIALCILSARLMYAITRAVLKICDRPTFVLGPRVVQRGEPEAHPSLVVLLAAVAGHRQAGLAKHRVQT
jgi:hypothetical protein